MTWRDLVPVIRAIYDRHGAGCCWHIVLDDGNFERSSRDFCERYARDQNCVGCIEATPVLQAASETQLRKAAHIWDCAPPLQ